LKNGDPIEIPSLIQIDYFLGKLSAQNQQIEIKDERSHKRL
jgi:hypothetical protein